MFRKKIRFIVEDGHEQLEYGNDQQYPESSPDDPRIEAVLVGMLGLRCGCSC
jgi:hypothetical protein